MIAFRCVLLYLFSLVLIIGCLQPADESAETIIERAKRLELDTEYVPPPGDPMAHHTMGFARTLCSAVFVTGLDADFAAESVGYFTSP